MILQREIIKLSEKHGVPTSTIDKDWVLGHFLNALFEFQFAKDLLVFKGGTCLRKCYFENYRFSEDLDFTLIDEKFAIDESIIKSCIKKAHEISGIKFNLFSLRKQIFEDTDQGYEIVIKFWGANHKVNQKPLPVNRWQDKIKLDIVFSEKVFEPTAIKPIIHNYSDKILITNQVNVYSCNEIIVEKLCSLIQRNRPRDIYDLWYLAKNIDIQSYTTLKDLLLNKAQHKKIKVERITQFINKDKFNANQLAWKQSLQTQLNSNDIPDFDQAYSQVHDFIAKILNS
ncbi:MAG: nucleotidyl transferase AbiEii/AbiGii toxin family protein [Bacteroidales bacterium]